MCVRESVRAHACACVRACESVPSPTVKSTPTCQQISVHVDGCLAAAAHTFVVGGAPALPRQVEAMVAAKTGALAALAKMRPGVSSLDVTPFIEKAALQQRCDPATHAWRWAVSVLEEGVS